MSRNNSDTVQRTRSSKYLALHQVLCVIGALLIFFCMSNTFALRHFTKYDSISESLKASRISDAAVPFTGKNVTDYIMSGYVADENVLREDIETSVDQMNLPDFLADKLAQQSALLRGESNDPVQVTPDEISDELERISAQLHESCQLIITEEDMTEIHNALDTPLSVVNSISSIFGNSQAGRAFQRFGISFGAYILESILLLLLMVRWGRIRKNAGKDSCGCFKGIGITLLIPAAICFAIVLCGGVSTWFRNDSIIGLYPFTKAFRMPYWWISITGLSFSFFMIELTNYLRMLAQSKPAEIQEKKPSPIMPSAPTLPTRAADGKYCIYCGKSIANEAKFCIYCGKSQTSQPAPNVSIPSSASGEETVSEESAADALE
ncbi:MAG: zinc ribbon domain-containing protein [Oscillospiraceae bacterium]|nr:zinc ribbon domain-containing protein [Oscillospiraceae bacterium]